MAITDYQGEEIIDSIVIKQGKKTFNKTYMPRTVFNDADGKDAYIIGNGESRKDFDLYSLPQDTYGCNALYRDYEPDYLVTVDQRMYKEIVESAYGEKNTVYTNRNNMKKYGGVCHLIPHNPYRGAGTTAMHIAMHDGHTNLICIGFDCAEDAPNNNVYKDTDCYNDAKTIVHQTVWAKQIYQLMQANPHVQWTFVGGNPWPQFFDLDNCTQISYNQLSTHINNRHETA
tara:strand:- start:424 stop:1110 length:687 start_codon:yes stop_codon:yes gene_type:complete